MGIKDEAVLKKIEAMTKKQFLPIIGREKGALIEKIVKKNKPKNCLEIGTLLGYSAILIARNLSKDAKLTTVEISPSFAKASEENIKEAGLSAKVKLKVGDALKVIPKLKEKFNFVFIDATKEEYLDYLKLLENKNISAGTVVIADNAKIFVEYMADYLDYVRNSGNYKSKYYDFGHDAMEVSIKL